MEITAITNEVWAILGSVNMGLVGTDDGLVAIDTGLDKQAAKRILRAAEEIGQPLCAIVNTHAHADHFGGNAFLLSQRNVPVYAPALDAPVIRRPRFEPEYLWGGAKPVAELLNKFLCAEPSRVDVEFSAEAFVIGNRTFRPVALPGHDFGQFGIRVDDVMFAADGYFGANVVEKHGIPFLVDYEQTIASATRIAEMDAGWFLPGHGELTTRPDEDVNALVNRHEAALTALIDVIGTGAYLDDAVAGLLGRFNLNVNALGQFLLLRTSIGSYVSHLVDTGSVKLGVVDGQIRVERA